MGAASSPFFQKILKINQHPHPLIYMGGLTSESLKVVIDYVYFGAASVVKENLENFMNIADELKLKGLTKNYNETNTIEKEAQQPETVHTVGDTSKVISNDPNEIEYTTEINDLERMVEKV